MHDPIQTLSGWLAGRAPNASLDSAGVAALRRDDATLMVIEVPPESDICYLSCLVATVDETVRMSMLSTALELNRFGKPLGGCWLAWDVELDALILCHNLIISKIDEIEFNNVVDNFLGAVDVSRAQLKISIAEAADALQTLV